MQDALLQVVWRSPGGHTDASFVVGGREIDLKMSNLDGFGQFNTGGTKSGCWINKAIGRLLIVHFCIINNAYAGLIRPSGVY